MTVYIEYFLAFNLALDLLICVLTLRIMRLRARPVRVLISVAAGTAAAFLYPFIHADIFVMLLIKAGLGASMVFLLYPFKNVKKYLLSLLTFLLITFAFGGASYAVMCLPAKTLNAVSSDSGSAAIAVLCGGAFVGYFLFAFVKYINRSRDTAGCMKKAAVYVGGRKAEFTAFLDTGNGLYEGGLPVVPVTREVFVKLFGRDAYEKINAQCTMHNAQLKVKKFGLFNKFFKRKTVSVDDDSAALAILKKGKFIDVSAAPGRGKIFVFRPDKIEIYSDKGANTIYDVAVGLYNGTLSKTGEYEGLLHPALLTEN